MFGSFKAWIGLLAALVGFWSQPVAARGFPGRRQPVAAFVEDGKAWLLDADGSAVWTATRDAPVREAFRLQWPAGRAAFGSTPLFVFFRGGWLVGSRRDELSRFSSSGSFLGTISLPEGANRVATRLGSLWFAPAFPKGPFWEFLVTRDLASYRRVLISPSPSDSIAAGPGGMLDAVPSPMSGGSAGLFFSRMVGRPVVFRVDEGGNRTELPLAYRRSRERDSLSRFVPSPRDRATSCRPSRPGSWPPVAGQESGPTPLQPGFNGLEPLRVRTK